ncbi:MAG TPA: diguanylate cyclase [Actinomycetes bacterium]|nr:diguanylate cyclase [Actinomycetes bacterium]
MLRLAAVAVALVGVVASAWIAQGWQRTVTRERDERLDRGAASRTATISSALRQYENALQAARSLWLASDEVSRTEFRIFAHTLELGQRYPGLQGISWRTVVPGDQAAEFVTRERRNGARGFTIRPPGRRPVYYVTVYTYPTGLFASTLGLDARATPSILANLEQARDTARTTMSGQTTLPDDLGLPKARRPVAFELFVPVHRDAELLGWASGRFRAEDFLEAALRTSQPVTGVELHDEEVGPRSLVASFPSGFRAEGPDVRTESFTFGGRRLVMRYAPLPGNSILTERTIAAPRVLGAGIAVSLMLGALLWLLAQVGALYQEVGRLARTDGLTGVANRRSWDDELSRALARAARSGQAMCVALIDLDHFKAYNDRHGHQAGDRLLKAAAAAWRSRLRKTDLLARYGGEEFAVLLPDCRLDDAMEISNRLRTAQPEGTCSIGVAVWDTREDGAELVARADRALYSAKESGRNRCCADRTAGTASASYTPTR